MGTPPAPRAVLLGSSVSALGVARTLGRRGVEVWALDAVKWAAGYSRFARFLRLPAVADEPSAWLDQLQRLSAKGSCVLFPLADEYLLFAAEHYAALAPSFRLVMPPPDSTRRIVDKRAQYRIAQAAGVAIPRTIFPESADDVRAASTEVEYPCLVKPNISHRGRARLGAKVWVAATPGELAAHFTALDPRDFLIQELVPGGDDAIFMYFSFWHANSEIASVTARKLRQSPAAFGDGSLVMTVEEPEARTIGQHLLRAFDYSGLADVEYKRDARNGALYLLEINARAPGNMEVARRAGVDLAWLAYQALGLNRIEPAPPFRPGVRAVNEEIDSLAMVELLRTGGQSLPQVLAPLRGAHPMIAAWDDPLPFLQGIARAGGRVFRR